MQKRERTDDPWRLKASDFRKKRLYAAQDWRFRMCFEYLRISPSYRLAFKCKDEAELSSALNDAERAAAVWRTRTDFGPVDQLLFREWWQRKGLPLFGIHSAMPRTERILRLLPAVENDEILATGVDNLGQFLAGRYADQGRPDSVLVSVPLGIKRTMVIRQLKKILADIEVEAAAILPTPEYRLEENKMRYQRLLSGLRLIYMRAARPEDELWRSAARAKISKTHSLNPKAPKKDANSAETRRMLTIMASRLAHDTLVVAENAACGRFPSTSPVSIPQFDYGELGRQIQAIYACEKERKKAMLDAAQA